MTLLDYLGKKFCNTRAVTVLIFIILIKSVSLLFFFNIPEITFHKDRISLYQFTYWVVWVSIFLFWYLWKFKNNISLLLLLGGTGLIVFLAEVFVILLDSSDLSIGARRINEWILYAIIVIFVFSWAIYIVSRRLGFSLWITWGTLFYFSGVFGLTLRIWSYTLDADGLFPMIYSGTITAFATYSFVSMLLLFSVVYLILFGPAVWSFFKTTPEKIRWKLHSLAWIALVLFLISVPALSLHQNYVNSSTASVLHEDIDWARPAYSDQLSKGTVVDMLQRKTNALPPGYEDGITALKKLVTHPTLPTEIPEDSKDITVVFYLLESFSYPPYAKSWKYTRSPTPFLDKLVQEYPSGPISFASGGGGTPLSQFEIITGLHSSFAQKIFLHFAQFKNNIPTFVDSYKKLGLTTNFLKTNRGIFSIDEALYKLGFTKVFRPMVDFPVLPEDRFPDDKNWLINNTAFTRHLIDTIETRNSQHLTFVQGIGAHGPWMDRMQPADPSMTMQKLDELSADDIERLDLYAKALESVDEDIKRITEYYEKQDKRTLILFYTDHSPGYFPRHIAKALNGVSDELETVKAIFSSGMYLLWANYPLDDHLQGRVYSHNRLSMDIQKHYLGFQPYYVQVLDKLLGNYTVASLFLSEDTRKNLRAKSEWSESETAMMDLYEIARFDLLDGPQQLLKP